MDEIERTRRIAAIATALTPETAPEFIWDYCDKDNHALHTLHDMASAILCANEYPFRQRFYQSDAGKQFFTTLWKEYLDSNGLEKPHALKAKIMQASAVQINQSGNNTFKPINHVEAKEMAVQHLAELLLTKMVDPAHFVADHFSYAISHHLLPPTLEAKPAIQETPKTKVKQGGRAKVVPLYPENITPEPPGQVQL